MWHGKFEVGHESVPLVWIWSDIIEFELIISCQRVHDVLPVLWQAVGLNLIDDLGHLELHFGMFETDNFDIEDTVSLLDVRFEVNNFTRAREFLTHQLQKVWD